MTLSKAYSKPTLYEKIVFENGIDADINISEYIKNNKIEQYHRTVNGGEGDNGYSLDITSKSYDITDNGGFDNLSVGNVNYDQLWFEQSGNDLKISMIGGENDFKVKDWYLSDNNKIEEIEVSSGQYVSSSNIDLLIQAMAGFNPPNSGTINDDPELSNALNNTLTQVWQTRT